MKPLVKSSVVLILVCVFAPINNARADYHYASHSGSDTYPYSSWETATDSIKYAIAAAEPGDTVYIGPGEYFEIVYMAGEDSNLALIGSGIDSTYWWWNVLGTHTLNCANNTIVKHIHIAHTRTGAIRSGIYNTIWVDGCLFTGMLGIQSSGYGVGSGYIENCIFRNVEGALDADESVRFEVSNCLVDSSEGTAFFDIWADTGLIENNIIIDVDNFNAISIFSQSDSVLIRNNLIFGRFPHDGDCWSCRLVVNNTFDNLRRTYDYAAIAVWEPFVVFKNNSFSRALTAFRLHQNGSWNVPASYSNLWDVDSFYTAENPGVTWDTVGITFNYPMFQNPDSGDYRLQAFSPLIDAGDPNILDVDGTRSDIGVFGGPRGRFYAYLDLPPDMPDSISYLVWNDTIYFDWRDNYEADFFGYLLHRDIISGFTPSPLNLIAEPESSFYPDAEVVLGEIYYYRIASLDIQGNRSEYSPEIAVTVTGVWQGDGAEMPRMTLIESNYPNPFNSSTTIVYSVANLGPIPAQINIDIYDLLGRKVRSLINERKEVGLHKIIWDGKSESGEDMPSGIYFARISQWQVALGGRPRKITLMR